MAYISRHQNCFYSMKRWPSRDTHLPLATSHINSLSSAVVVCHRRMFKHGIWIFHTSLFARERSNWCFIMRSMLLAKMRSNFVYFYVIVHWEIAYKWYKWQLQFPWEKKYVWFVWRRRHVLIQQCCLSFSHLKLFFSLCTKMRYATHCISVINVINFMSFI